MKKKNKKRGRELFKKHKVILTIGIKIFSILPKWGQIFLWDIVSPYTQKIFEAFRYIILCCMAKEYGDNIRIGRNVTIIGWEQLSLGNNISIHANSYIDATGGIIIKDNVSIAHNTSILTTNHTWDNIDIPIKYNKITSKEVIIGNNIWIGCGCRILAGTIISDRVVIAAGSIVNKDCESNFLYAGVPSKKIKRI